MNSRKKKLISLFLLSWLASVQLASADSVSYEWLFPSDAMSWVASGSCSGSNCVVADGWNSTAPTSIWFRHAQTSTSDRSTPSFYQSPNFLYGNGTPSLAWVNFSYRANMTGTASSIRPNASIMKPDGSVMMIWSTTIITSNTAWINVAVNVPTNNFSQSGNYMVHLNATLFGTNNPANARISWDSVYVNLTYPTYVPPNPVSVANNSGYYWVNQTWNAGVGNVTDSYNVSVVNNSVLTWYNGTTVGYNNTTTCASCWVNITVWSYNSTATGKLSSGSMSNNTQAPATPLVDTSFTVTIPAGQSDTYGMYFNATNKSSKNVSASGQDSTNGWINITNTGNAVLKFYINVSGGDIPNGVSLKSDVDNNPDGAKPTNGTLLTIIDSLSIGSSQSIWMWADYTNALPMTNSTLQARVNSSTL